MKQLRVEPLSMKFSIVKDHLWCIYDEDRPLFHGSAIECRDWLDRHEALSLPFQDPTAVTSTESPPSFWNRILGFSFRRSRTA
ncbi:MAG: hypothetical protein JWP89_467 [Schlesneria sp.]|nr:hypothetical protein [Schlesneria sp.]